MEVHFQFKDLIVWQKAMIFADDVLTMIETVETQRKHFRLFEQLEAAATSVALNIAEGKGRNTNKEFSHFLYISRGSLYETITLLNIFQKRKWITEETLIKLEKQAFEIASMLKGLINSLNKG